MRRVVVVIVATVAAAVLLAMFHTTPEAVGALGAGSGGRSVVSPTTTPAAGAPPSGGGSDSGAATTTTPRSSGGTRTVTGPVEETRYGPVQVRVTVSGSKLTAVENLQLPSDRARSQRISSIAGPELITEALQAQSAQIDGVSGATFTSEGFAQSLQAALASAGLGN